MRRPRVRRCLRHDDLCARDWRVERVRGARNRTSCHIRGCVAPAGQVRSVFLEDCAADLNRVAAQLELDFNSVERIVEYLDVPQERPAIIPDHRPPAYWPSSSGGIVVEDLVVRYAPNLPEVLKGLSFSLSPAEKIGIVRQAAHLRRH